MGDFLKCPRLYYLRNVYKDPKTRRKIAVVSSAMSLGSAVHNTLEALKEFPVEERLTRDLLADYEEYWKAVSGEKGGFKSEEEEAQLKARGKAMIERVIAHPGPLYQKTVRLKKAHNDMPQNFYLSEEDNIILCGLIDWIEYIEADDSLRVIDFKTGKNEEDDNSLQLPIYILLLNALQKRKVSGVAYWYLDKDDVPVDKTLPDLEESRARVLEVAKKVKEAREKKAYDCPRGEGGCFACRDLEKVLRGEAKCVGVSSLNADVYLV
jgi:ATP-dependent helicase/DNAse subunit B